MGFGSRGSWETIGVIYDLRFWAFQGTTDAAYIPILPWGSLTYGTNYYLFPTFASGYEFNSWAKTDSATNAALSSTSTENAYYTMGAGAGALTLTSKQSCTAISGYMQDFTGGSADSCDTGTLTDKRGNKTYTVAKLADGNWWMTTNLNLAGGTALSADDTDVSSAYIASFSTSNNLTKSGSTIVLPASSNSGFNANNYSYVYNSGSTTCASGSPCYSYYSWDAATLGSGRSISTTNTDAQQSICPKGWKLPSTYDGTNSTTDFRALMIAYGGSSAIQYYNTSTTPTGATMKGKIGPGTTPNFLFAGSYSYGSFDGGGSSGAYWSSTSYSSTSSARYLEFASSYVGSAHSYGRNMGMSVRCLLKPTMQSATSESLATMLPNNGDITMLKDERDGKYYTVGKLADGNYWMLDNLALDPTAVSLADLQGKTNASDTTLNYLKNGGGTTSDKYPTAKLNNVAWTSSSQNYYSIPMVITDYINTVPSDATSTAGGWKVGVYYNLCAASAGSYCYGNGTSAGTSSGNVTSDICPKGWRMPTGGSSGEYQALYSNSNYNTYDKLRAALHLPLSGSFYSGSAYDQGSSGYFWSSTRSNSSGMYGLFLDTSGVSSASYGTRRYGFSMRCVLGS